MTTPLSILITLLVGERRLFYLLNENVPEFHLSLLLEVALVFPRVSPALGVSAPGDTHFANSGNGASACLEKRTRKFEHDLSHPRCGH